MFADDLIRGPSALSAFTGSIHDERESGLRQMPDERGVHEVVFIGFAHLPAVETVRAVSDRRKFGTCIRGNHFQHQDRVVVAHEVAVVFRQIAAVF